MGKIHFVMIYVAPNMPKLLNMLENKFKTDLKSFKESIYGQPQDVRCSYCSQCVHKV